MWAFTNSYLSANFWTNHCKYICTEKTRIHSQITFSFSCKLVRLLKDCSVRKVFRSPSNFFKNYVAFGRLSHYMAYCVFCSHSHSQPSIHYKFFIKKCCMCAYHHYSRHHRHCLSSSQLVFECLLCSLCVCVKRSEAIDEEWKEETRENREKKKTQAKR